MLNPTPSLQPSPLDIGSLFSASFTALRRRFGLFVLIALLPSIVTLVIVAVGVVLVVAAIGATAGFRSSSPAPLVIVGILVVVLGGLIGALVQLKAYGLMSLAAYEIAQGQRPNLSGLLQRSRGFLPRMAAVIAIVFGAAIVFYAAFFGILAGVVNVVSRSGGREPAAALAGAVGLFLVLMLAAVPVAIFFSTKLLYTVPAVALEGLGGIEGLKRSWTLTKGSFWRTLGYYFVGYLAVTVVTYIVSMLGQIVLVPFSAGLSEASRTSDPQAILAAFMGFIPAMLLLLVLQLAVSVISWPFLQSYTTYMFIDQVRRSELPASGYGYPAPQAYGTPAAYYGQPQPGQPGQYPAQGFPSNGYPSQGYGAPGQPYPGQQAQGWHQSSGWTGQPQQADPRRAWDAPQTPGAQQPPSDQGWSRPQGPDEQQR